MATTKTAKVEADIVKTKAKISELQTRLKELESKKTAIQNSEIVDIVRGIDIPLDELATLLQSVRNGEAHLPVSAIPVLTSGQHIKKSAPPNNDEMEDNGE